MTLSGRFDDAFRYAHQLHYEQRRKGTNAPYIGHLMGVASIVLDDGGSEDEAIGALLHDAAEDHGGRRTLDEIRTRFGDTIEGRGGNDAFYSDDTTAIVTLDGGVGDDSFQIGQIFGERRDQAEGLLLAQDVFTSLVPTTRGWLSPGISAPMVVQGGTGNVTLSLGNCDPTGVPIWFGVQNGNGPWTNVPRGANDSFTFTIETTGAFAYVTQDGTDFSTKVIYLTAAEARSIALGSLCATSAQTGTKQLSGTVETLSGQVTALNNGWKGISDQADAQAAQAKGILDGTGPAAKSQASETVKSLTAELKEKLKDVLPPPPPKKELPNVEVKDLCPECGALDESREPAAVCARCGAVLPEADA